MYCKHGTNIGTPSGPDILCGDCEDGTPAPEPTPTPAPEPTPAR